MARRPVLPFGTDGSMYRDPHDVGASVTTNHLSKRMLEERISEGMRHVRKAQENSKAPAKKPDK